MLEVRQAYSSWVRHQDVKTADLSQGIPLSGADRQRRDALIEPC
jgi:hypothetical protein